MTKKRRRKKRRHLRRSVKIILTVICLILGVTLVFNIAEQRKETAATPTPELTPTPEPTPVEEHYSASLFMVGDSLLHLTVVNDAQIDSETFDFGKQLYRIADIAQDYDLRFYNQETILGGNELGFQGYPTFNSPTQFGEYMVSAGFNLVSLSNNHSYDQGLTGVENSVAFWKEQTGVHTAGMYDNAEDQAAIPVYEVNGITYTFLAWTYGLNGFVLPDDKPYLVNTYQDGTEAMLEQVRQASTLADVCIVSVHWGYEYWNTPNDEQKELALELSEAGADIIIGNHAHTVQPVEWVNDHKTIVFYALGNLISAQDQLLSWIGMMGALTINKTVIGEETTVSISDVKADLFYNYIKTGWTDFQVIPFSQITDEYLANHEAIYEEYAAIITEYDDSIQVGGFD